jgi:hypothetical protein
MRGMMKNRWMDDDFEDVSILIRKEEEEALGFFRTRKFRDKVKEGLKKEAPQGIPPVPFRRTAVPVLVVALVVIMAVIFLFVLNRPGTGRRPEFSALASALGRLPGFSRPPGWEWTMDPGRTGTSWLAESVRRILVLAEETKRKEDRTAPIPAETGRIPRLSIDRKMEILFKEKAIERALLLFKGDSKEV